VRSGGQQTSKSCGSQLSLLVKEMVHSDVIRAVAGGCKKRHIYRDADSIVSGAPKSRRPPDEVWSANLLDPRGRGIGWSPEWSRLLAADSTDRTQGLSGFGVGAVEGG